MRGSAPAITSRIFESRFGGNLPKTIHCLYRTRWRFLSQWLWFGNGLPSQEVQVSSALDSLPKNCPVTKCSLNAERPAKCEVPATLKFGDKVFFVSCDQNKAEESMRAEACRVGAKAITILKENKPDLWSTCYRGTANLVYLEAP